MDGVARYIPEHDVKLLAHGSFLVDSFLSVLIMQSDGVEVFEGPGLSTTLSYVAFTNSESMIGDAMRIQRTPRSKPAACSLTRMMERWPSLRVLPLLRTANV